jgi:PAS domain S-box-containing protein
MKICIVEDNPDHQIIFKKKLKEFYKNIDVDTAADVDEAKNLLEKANYDTVLIDYRLRGSSGIDLVHHIHDIGIDVPMIMITSTDDIKIAVEAMKLGVYDYVCKTSESFEQLPRIIDKVTKEYQLKKRLKEAEFRYRTIVNGMNEAVFLMNEDGTIPYVSSSVERLLGYSEEDFKSDFLLLLREKDRELFMGNMKSVQAGEEVEPFVLSLKGPRGEVVSIEINASRLKEGGEGSGVVGTIQDVTKRLRLEKEIESEREKIGDIFNSMMDWIYVVDEKFEVQFINRSFEKVVGKPLSKKCFELIYGQKAPCTFCKWKSIRRGYTVRWELRREDGKTFDIISSPLKNPDGSLYNMIILRDITRKKEVEEKYRRLSEETLKANQELKATIEQLKKTQEQLIQSEKLAAIGKLVSGVAHELNNPLFSAMGYAELLFMDSLGEENQKEKLQNILDSIKRARSIIKDLLKFARRENVEKEIVNINEVVMKTLSLRQYELRVNNIEVKCDLAESMPPVMGNFVRLQQVLLNIIINAEQSIQESGTQGLIRIRTVVLKPQQTVKIDIADNGREIPSEIMGKIFDPFFTTKEVGKGTGLGLSTSYGIIKDHNGEIGVKCVRGWTTFTITLPYTMAEKPEPARSSPRQEKEIKAQGETILVVDDEPIIVNLLEDFLKRKGFSVLKATSGADALAKLDGNEVELIISDIKMPEMDGKRFYTEIRTKKPELLSRLIFITGDTLNSETRAFLREIKGYHLKKPFSFDEITDVIHAVTRKNSQRQLF